MVFIFTIQDLIWTLIYVSVSGYALFAVMTVMLMLSRRRMGVVWPWGKLTLRLNPDMTYDKLWTKSDGATIRTQKWKEVFHSRDRTTYNANGTGPALSIVDGLGDTAINARMAHYVMKLRRGEVEPGVHFDSYDQACLYAYEHFIVPRFKDNDEGRKKKEDAAQNIARARRSPVFTKQLSSQESEDLDPSTGQPMINSGSQLVQVKPFDEKQYERFLISVKQQIIEAPEQIMKLEYDGETIDLRGYSKWANTPAPALTLKAHGDERYMLGKTEQLKAPDALLKYAVAFVIIIGGVAIFAIILFKLLG